MATVRSGHQPVLVIVDVQVGVMGEAWQAERVIANVKTAVARARAAQVPVLWVQHGDAEMPRDSAAWQWVPGLGPQGDEVLIHKAFNSAFEQTPLEQVLAQLVATHLFLAGASTNWCIRATAYAALERGYDLTLVQDAHTTQSIPLGEDKAIAAEDIVRELNIVMQWLSYPGRNNAVAKAGALNFKSPQS
jgi:nicotinamidase-related amidase